MKQMRVISVVLFINLFCLCKFESVTTLVSNNSQYLVSCKCLLSLLLLGLQRPLRPFRLRTLALLDVKKNHILRRPIHHRELHVVCPVRKARLHSKRNCKFQPTPELRNDGEVL